MVMSIASNLVGANTDNKKLEIIDLAGFLTNCGAVVEGAGTDTLYITGRRRLYGSEYKTSFSGAGCKILQLSDDILSFQQY
ncbi:hypothetical protein HAX54_010591 [Datura stramonium]|uniref:Uncharacterized protein n=1 Tax=Datura stramonium TaxID=4076 RepID=A0ABS8TI40_DATST|nr:hypothetical protein [Datura stramonium]